jgi:hypothetical protein
MEGRRVMVDDKGWAFATNGKKSHYFIDGISLCQKYEFYGWVTDNNHKHKDNCKICKERLEKSHEL